MRLESVWVAYAIFLSEMLAKRQSQSNISMLLLSGDMDIRIANKYRLGRKIGGGSFGDIYVGKIDHSDTKTL